MRTEEGDQRSQGGRMILPIKKRWFDMILSGKKKEEYREIKPYWTARFLTWLGYPKSVEADVLELLKEMDTRRPREVLFRNGYSADSPSFAAMCTLRIGTGKETWGAEPGRPYFVLTIHSISIAGKSLWKKRLMG